MSIEDTVLYNLIRNDDYVRAALPFIKTEYFEAREDKVMFDAINDYVVKYKKPPTLEALKIEIGSRDDLNDEMFSQIGERLEEYTAEREKNDRDWLLQQTEKWCQERSVYLAIMQSIEIIDNPEGAEQTNVIPELLQNALAVNFDTNIGHDYFKDAADRFDYYNNPEAKLRFDLDLLNKITKGGVVAPSLTVFLAGTGVGKSITLCHLAAAYTAMGKNVVYITLEMPEEECALRVDANLMKAPADMVKKLKKKQYASRIKNLYNKINGRLIVKEYPAHIATSKHFRHLLKELEMKKKFKVDVLIIDYLSICGSGRYKSGGVNPSYYLKSVAEELRGLGQEFQVPVFSAAQFNREGMSDTDADLDKIAESIGVTHTADLVLSLARTEELDNLGQIQIKQLKNRYNDINYYRRFVVGVDLAQSRLYDLNEAAQDNIVVETPEKRDNKKKAERKQFDGFKM